MIKEIIGTIVCTIFNIRSTPLTKTTPLRVNNYQNIEGLYCLKDELGHMDVNNLSFEMEHYVYSYDENYFIKMNYLSISQQLVNNQWYYSFRNAYYDETDALIEEYQVQVTSQELEDASNKAHYYMIYVPTPYSIDAVNGNYERFMQFYTNTTNNYMISINSWYSFNDATGSNYQIIGTFNANNTLYGLLDYLQNNKITFKNPNYLYPDRPAGNNYELYNNGFTTQNHNVYMNVQMMPKYIYTEMINHGVFQYIPYEQQVYSFQDFFFGIVDAPLMYLYNLFSFDLFGLNVFIAFCGVITISLIIIVVKKVW